MGGLKEEDDRILLILSKHVSEVESRIKHQACIKTIVAELDDKSEIDLSDTSSVPEADEDMLKRIKDYRICYKVGPCRDDCDLLLPEIQARGCYNGRVDRVELSGL